MWAVFQQYGWFSRDRPLLIAVGMICFVFFYLSFVPSFFSKMNKSPKHCDQAKGHPTECQTCNRDTNLHCCMFFLRNTQAPPSCCFTFLRCLGKRHMLFSCAWRFFFFSSFLFVFLNLCMPAHWHASPSPPSRHYSCFLSRRGSAWWMRHGHLDEMCLRSCSFTFVLFLLFEGWGWRGSLLLLL